jgi:peptidyl-prolyl cis-trans isomerase B (cyclophilin B)
MGKASRSKKEIRDKKAARAKKIARAALILAAAAAAAALVIFVAVPALRPAQTAPPQTGGAPRVELTMESGGVVTLELDGETAPITVANFLKLVNEGFYDGLTFHRVMQGFMIQGGDPLGTGTGGSGENIKGEFSANGVENNISHTRGVISMARSTPMDSASCQFFITNADAAFLDGNYAAFGRVVGGMDVVDEISAVPTTWNITGDEKSVPIEPVIIKTIRAVK